MNVILKTSVHARNRCRSWGVLSDCREGESCRGVGLILVPGCIGLDVLRKWYAMSSGICMSRGCTGAKRGALSGLEGDVGPELVLCHEMRIAAYGMIRCQK